MEYGESGYIRLCVGAMMGDQVVHTCWNLTKEDIDKFAEYWTFAYVME